MSSRAGILFFSSGTREGSVELASIGIPSAILEVGDNCDIIVSTSSSSASLSAVKGASVCCLKRQLLY